MFISDPGTCDNVVQGNYIGTGGTGTMPVGNGYEGVAVQEGAASNFIGGTITGEGNVISANYYGLVVYGPASGNVIQGNLIGTDVSGKAALPGVYEGLVLENGAASNLVGGTVMGAGNLISGNYYGLVVSDTGTSGNVIQGNLIGTDISGKLEVPGTYEGLALGGGATANTIGGAVNGARNVISGNYDNVVVRDPGTSGNVFQGNFIGTDITGEAGLANQNEGFALGNGAASNLIGGTITGAGNVISSNWVGVFIGDTNTSANVFQGNFIGTDVKGTNALSNGYLDIELAGGASGNFIGGATPGAGNTIAFADYGVAVYDTGTTNNAIRGNMFFSNAWLGIDLDGFPGNHAGFLAGPNDWQNYPFITNAFGDANTTVIAGALNSLPGQSYSVDLYRNPGNDDEGRFYLGAISLTTDGSGNSTFVYTNTLGNYTGQYLTAAATSSGGDTSEFSPAVLATNLPAPSALFTGEFLLNASGFNFSVTLQPNFNYTVQSATNLAAPINWIDLTNFTATNSLLNFTDRSATNSHAHYYRVISP